MKRWLGRWWLAIGWMGIIFWLSNQPKPPFAGLLERIDWGDKIAHFFVYSILGMLVWRAIGRADRTMARWMQSVGISAFYGLTDELHQIWVPGRSFDLIDLSVDVLGAAIAAGMLSRCCGGD